MPKIRLAAIKGHNLFVASFILKLVGFMEVMMNHKRILFLFSVFGVLTFASISLASDLDDGISKPLDEAISRDDELGQKDRNISYIKLKAKSDAAVRSQKGIDQGKSAGGQSASGSGNMNSVVLGPGGNVRGDIIIIDQSRGDKTQVVDH